MKYDGRTQRIILARTEVSAKSGVFLLVRNRAPVPGARDITALLCLNCKHFVILPEPLGWRVGGGGEETDE